MPTTIAYIAGQFPLRSETFVYREVRELRRRGWNVVCVTLRPPADPPPESEDLIFGRITVYDGWVRSAITESGTHPLISTKTMLRAEFDAIAPGEPMTTRQTAQVPAQAFAAQALARRLRDLKVRHIHCHFAHSPTTIGMYAAHQLGVRFSFTGHANDLFQRRFLLKRKLERAAFVSCISQEHRKLYNSIHSRPDADYPIIRCGVDVEDFAGSSRQATDEEAKRIVTVCRLVEKKGVDTLIRAFSKLQTANVKLTIAGDGPQRAELEQIAREGNVADRVEFLGAVSNDRVRELLQSSDVFALPCRVDRNGDKDGIPVVLMEAMACGVPVLSGDLPAIRELVIDNNTGRLVDGNDAVATAAALDALLTDRGASAILGAAGRARVVDEFSLARNVDRLEHAINTAFAP